MSHYVASDLGLHCLPVSVLGVFRLQWVMCFRQISESRFLLAALQRKSKFANLRHD